MALLVEYDIGEVYTACDESMCAFTCSSVEWIYDESIWDLWTRQQVMEHTCRLIFGDIL